jgi:hypothetical protein
MMTSNAGTFEVQSLTYGWDHVSIFVDWNKKKCRLGNLERPQLGKNDVT